jgi:hypothetical protein
MDEPCEREQTLLAMTKQWTPPYVRFDSHDVETEQLQTADEGRALTPAVERELARLRASDMGGEADQQAFLRLLDEVQALPIVAEYPHEEPSDLPGILAARPSEKSALEVPVGGVRRLEDRVAGAWMGRCAGCLLGTPVEGWQGPHLEDMLRETGRWPLRTYMRGDVPDAVRTKYHFNPQARWVDCVDHMPEDDDLNYTLIALTLMRDSGVSFSPLDVATCWLRFLPPWRTCTAERIAIRNFMLAIEPPRSATHRNPYREWIGAQIRGDFFGYAMPGQPERAADLAWRDACISHVRNGIYGEMWVAAMVAAAAATDDPRAAVEEGLRQIPAQSRFAKALRDVLRMHADGATHDEFVSDHRRRWDPGRLHNWVHTIPNAEIVAAALLWGAGDFGSTLCLAVQCGMDTDCNGATAGSVAGMMAGADALPAEWTAPLGGRATFGIVGVDTVPFDRLVADTMDIIRQAGDE